jgi:hypothetical protein
MTAGKIPQPVEDTETARRMDKEAPFKIDWKTGEEIQRSGGIEKIFAVRKSLQPKVWIGVEGKVAPGDVGATKEYPGVFTIIQHGTYELGAQKDNFREFFMHGQEGFRGRIVFRLLGRSGKWQEVGKEPFVWFYWKPDDQRPYILEHRAVAKRWVPTEDSSSALPSEWEAKIPDELRWWGRRLPLDEKIRRIDEAQKLLKKAGAFQKLNAARYVLQRHWWKGQKVVRDMPVEHWDLRIDTGAASLTEFTLDANPLIQKDGINALAKTCLDKSWMDKSGDIPPGQPGNPNKDIPAHVEMIDKGVLNLINAGPDFYSFEVRSGKLGGYWILKGEGGQLVMEKARLPAPKLGSLHPDAIESLCEAGSKRIRTELQDLIENAE